MRIRRAILFCLLLVTPAGFLFKFYGGPGKGWFNDYGVGLLYEVFWILFVFLFFPKEKSITKISLAVFLATCALECLQLWHPPVLETLRSCFLGRALIGTSFAWWDFPHYLVGCMIGWLWLKWLTRAARRPSDRFGR